MQIPAAELGISHLDQTSFITGSSPDFFTIGSADSHELTIGPQHHNELTIGSADQHGQAYIAAYAHAFPRTHFEVTPFILAEQLAITGDPIAALSLVGTITAPFAAIRLPNRVSRQSSVDTWVDHTDINPRAKELWKKVLKPVLKYVVPAMGASFLLSGCTGPGTVDTTNTTLPEPSGQTLVQPDNPVIAQPAQADTTLSTPTFEAPKPAPLPPEQKKSVEIKLTDAQKAYMNRNQLTPEDMLGVDLSESSQQNPVRPEPKAGSTDPVLPSPQTRSVETPKPQDGWCNGPETPLNGFSLQHDKLGNGEQPDAIPTIIANVLKKDAREVDPETLAALEEKSIDPKENEKDSFCAVVYAEPGIGDLDPTSKNFIFDPKFGIDSKTIDKCVEVIKEPIDNFGWGNAWFWNLPKGIGQFLRPWAGVCKWMREPISKDSLEFIMGYLKKTLQEQKQ